MFGVPVVQVTLYFSVRLKDLLGGVLLQCGINIVPN